MSQELMRLPQLETPAAIAEYSRDPLGFMTRCADEYGEIVPLQFEEERFCLHPALTALMKKFAG
jgi:hypothetical protein